MKQSGPYISSSDKRDKNHVWNDAESFLTEYYDNLPEKYVLHPVLMDTCSS